MKKKSFVLLTLTLLLFIGNSCKQENVTLDDYPDVLTEEQAMALDTVPSTHAELSEILLPNGMDVRSFFEEVDSTMLIKYGRVNKQHTINDILEMGPQTQKNYLISIMSAEANYLTNRHNLQYANEGENKPAQNGLAYVLGASNYYIRKSAKQYGYGTCKEELHGLDCSGFLFNLFDVAGIPIDRKTAAEYANPNILQTAIRNISGLEKIEVKDVGKIATNKFESGDIIYWKNNLGSITHIGIILKKTDGTLAVFQSNGSGSSECIKNYGPTRGPRTLTLAQAPDYFIVKDKPEKSLTFGGIVRIVTNISGNWDFVIKCSGTNFDFLTLNLDFPTNQDKAFQIVKDQIYPSDNVLYHLVFDFNYNQTSNTLTCSFETTADVYPNFKRIDEFEIKLNKDDTGYFPAMLTFDQDAGCQYDVKLINKE